MRSRLAQSGRLRQRWDGPLLRSGAAVKGGQDAWIGVGDAGAAGRVQR